MIKAGVVGATGYVGSELIRILMQHPNVSLNNISSKSYSDTDYSNVFSNFNHIQSLKCERTDIQKFAEECDVIFIALPHGIASKEINDDILKNTIVIDMGADFRFKDVEVYETWYKTKHQNTHLLSKAVYGLCELKRDKIKDSRLIANPGCYTTCSILSLAPLIKAGILDNKSIIIDAKSGVSGAGRGVTLNTHFTEINENIMPYNIASHRHTPEIEEQLSEISDTKITLSFTPHLIPINRGIITTAYANLNDKYSYYDIEEIFGNFYKDEFFIRLKKQDIFPELKWIKGSNFCDIGFKLDERTNRIIVIGALDNLIKGAAGQAIQNMNILFNLDEKTGIENIPLFPI